MSRKFAAIIILSISLLFLVSCTQSSTVMKQTEPETTQSTALPTTPLPPTAVPDTPIPTSTPNFGLDCTGDLSRPEIKVIYDYADALNKKQYKTAYSLIDTVIKDGYANNNYAALRNIGHLEIKLLIDKSDKGWYWVSPHIPKPEHFYSYKIFYAEIEYKINNVITTDLQDGIAYRKIITVQDTKDSPWQIAEWSTLHEVDKGY